MFIATSPKKQADLPASGASSNPGAAHVDLSVVLPRVRETADELLAAVGSIRAAVEALGLRAEVIIVDDSGRGDLHSEALSTTPGVVLLTNPRNRGKGYSVRQGVLSSVGSLVAFMDSDLPVDLSALVEALAALGVGDTDAVIGNRYAAETVTIGQAIPARRLASRVFRRFARMIAVREINDSQCPLKLLKRDAALAVFSVQRIDGFAFDAEMLFLLRRLGFRVRQIPVVWRDARAGWSIAKTTWVLVTMMFDLAWARLWWMVRSPRPIAVIAPRVTSARVEMPGGTGRLP